VAKVGRDKGAYQGADGVAVAAGHLPGDAVTVPGQGIDVLWHTAVAISFIAVVWSVNVQ